MFQLRETFLQGCVELIPNIFTDHRGESIKTYHSDAFKNIGISHDFKEDLMVTSQRGVLRGLHLQYPPKEQAKLIYCVRGSIFDVAVDVRKTSPTYGQFVSFHVDAEKHNLVYIPSGFAHGYLVLEDDTTVVYKMSSVYSPELESGFLWNSLNIDWPITEPILSYKDSQLPLFKDFRSAF
ncbi:dTDP-4-dehydrorhamnose 3,5-epimerase [Heliorestis convoluta]|uniref:dTDP-4-dehydrorhamnose 3,5-epimerase n=1 Tax=Heliorestis convoluta TaxID=356322 RepID=A0A5Q2N0P4_9FIRM|nr:dTDP-4-dehydrorhamnose 3,5-epimerase [Heliorestis convoluta]QGG48894.1 dTDP-4-dehydrorhamnose 3,5-epimerase [Heliorestis convoluta]